MKLHHSLSLWIATFAFAGMTYAGEVNKIAYPTAESASFVISAPEDWKLDPAEESGGYFDLSGPTGAVFSFRTIPGNAEALEAAIKESVEEVSKMYKNVELGDAQDWKPNGLEGFYAVGTGKDPEDGATVRFGMGWCLLKDETIAELWFVTDDKDAAGLKVAEKIANSLTAP